MVHPATPIKLKASVYAFTDPESGLYYSVCRREVSLRARGQATLFTSREQAIEIGARRLAGIPCEFVRLDA